VSISNSVTQVKVSVPAHIAADFKAACLNSGVSMASVLSQYMAKYCNVSDKHSSATALSTKRQRRAAIAKAIIRLQQILRAEEGYRDRIPQNLQASSVFDAAEQWVAVLEEVIESLEALP